ncbi:MAG: carbohydrate ABC transporter substrate-binding protein [Lachnospiraceae bacterium]|nr:carbohydrate ABC transporter substrate-binding protein [Lachnospiraceae bacterium]
MKLKKFLALTMATVLTMSFAGCGDDNTTATTNQNVNNENKVSASLKYTDIVLGETGKDIEASIKVLSHRTDLEDTKFPEYIASFNEMYPGITVEYETITDYQEQALLRIEQEDWDIMMIPAVNKSDLPTYFVPFGTLDEMDAEIRFANTWMNGENVYGVPSTGNAQGIVYNKAVFEAAGVTELPKTPDEFMNALKAVDEKTEAIPLYTNYAAGWTMGGQWDAYIGGSSNGDAAFLNQKMLHAQNPFGKEGDVTGPYAVYKILYDAVANGLTEEDYTTTDWEGSKGMINSGEIATMVLGSWAFTQMVDAGPNGDDIGYMPFPITIDGKQYASAGADYSYGVNAKVSKEKQQASMIYVKWLTECSGFAYSEGGIPIDVEGEYPALYSAFDGIEFVASEAALPGEEDLMNQLNEESELMVNAGGDRKVQEIVEHAATGDMSYADIMASWNKAWSDAQSTLGVKVQ